MKKDKEYKNPFHTYYARTQTRGYCHTRGGAIKSVVKHLIDNDQRRATIESHADGKTINVEWTGFWGLIIQEVKHSAKVIPFKASKKARKSAA